MEDQDEAPYPPEVGPEELLREYPIVSATVDAAEEWLVLTLSNRMQVHLQLPCIIVHPDPAELN